jgi:ubiquitin C-terminal hydrolase
MIIPENFVQSIYENFKYFPPKTQQDAQEFLTVFLDKLDSEIASNFKEVGFVQKLFQGQYTYLNKCNDCGYESQNIDFFSQLNLSISDLNVMSEEFFTEEESEIINNPNGIQKIFSYLKQKTTKKSVNLSVYDCLKFFFGHQEIEKFCEVCANMAFHSTHIQINSLPDYLLISFKRFKYNYWSSKISEQVYLSKDLEFKILDPNIDQESDYVLTAVIEHSGFAFQGHYKIYLNLNNTWWVLDDKSVYQTDFATVFRSQAYISLYTRRKAWDDSIASSLTDRVSPQLNLDFKEKNLDTSTCFSFKMP